MVSCCGKDANLFEIDGILILQFIQLMESMSI